MTEIDRVKLVEKRVTALEKWRQEVEKLLTFTTPQVETTTSAPIEPEEEEFDIPEREEKKPPTTVIENAHGDLMDYPPTYDDIKALVGETALTENLEYLNGGGLVKPRKRLADAEWKIYNETLRKQGYKWTSDKTNNIYGWVYINKKDVATVPIYELEQGKQKSFNIKGVLMDSPTSVEVNTSQGPSIITKVTLADETGEVRVSAWGKDGDKLKKLTAGEKVLFESLYKVDEPFEGVVQVTTGKFYTVSKLG